MALAETITDAVRPFADLRRTCNNCHARKYKD